MQKHAKTIQTNITRNYIPDWGVVEAARELIQNAIDSDRQGFNISYDQYARVLQITTNTELPLSALYMGESSKRDDTTMLGAHGEGLKLAMLVLLRENRDPEISSRYYINPNFINIDGLEVLAIDYTENVYYDWHPDQSNNIKTNISFVVNEDEWKQIQQIYLPLDTPLGILEDHPEGSLFVGGLKVANVNYNYAYNLDPAKVKLERDRRVADPYKLQEAIAHIWNDSQQWDAIAQGLLKGYNDFEGFTAIEANQELIDAVAKIADSFSTPPMDWRQSSAGYRGTYVPSSFYAVYSQSSKKVMPSRSKQPSEILEEWFEKNKSYFRKQGKARMAELVKESKKWGIK